MTQPAVKARSGWFDEIVLLRGIAILSVLSLHAINQAGEHLRVMSPTLAFWITVEAFTHGVMTFIAVSGFVLANKYGDNTDWLEFYRKRAMVIIPPYLFFSAVNVIGIRWGTEHPIDAAAIVKATLKGDSAAHMWFFVSIIQLYFLFPVIYRVYVRFESRKRELRLLAWTFGAFVAWKVLAGVLAWAGPMDNHAFAKIMELVPRRFFLNSLFYFLLGIYVRRNYEAVRAKVRAIPFAVLAAVLAGVGALTAFVDLAWTVDHAGINAHLWGLAARDSLKLLMNLLLIAAHFRLACHLAARRSVWTGWVTAFSRLSYGLYLIHVVMQVQIQRGLMAAGLSYGDFFLYPVLWAANLSACYWSVLALSKLPYSEWFLGVKKPAANAAAA